jgi:capsular exopolysaccharide synthesis family protein
VQKEELLLRALDAQKVQVDTLNQDSIQYNILQRQVETDRQLYDGLLQRMKEAGVSAGMQSSNIHVVDKAQAPLVPHSPNKPRNLALGLAVGLFLGVGLAFFVERLDSSIKTPDDIDRFIDLPSLGVIPSVTSIAAAGPKRKLPSGETKPDVGMVTHTDAMSLLSEAYRDLRASVTLSSGAETQPRILLLTSSMAEEGKTTTAINLSITLAQTGVRVVLLDCDLRRPQIHRVMGLGNDDGLSGYLSETAELADVVKATEVSNLFVIPAGPPPKNPAELLGSSKMKEALALLAGEYEYVVIDSPPVLSVSDARILATLADGVILVVKGGETPKESVRRSKRLIEDVHGHLLGTLLNNVNVRSADYNHYSSGYYSSYYSSDGDDEKG